MNRSILIVICDFLLLSLLTFSTDLTKMAGTDEGSQPTAKVDVAAKTADNNAKDLEAVMKQALNEEQKNREQLQAELAKARETAQQQQAQLQQHEQQSQQLQQQAQQLLQQQSNLQQQYASAQANIQNLSQKLQTTSAEATESKQKLETTETEVQKQTDLANDLQKQLAQLNGKLQAAELAKGVAAGQLAMMQQQVEAERAQNAQLAEGVKALATNSGALTQEIRENRALAPNTIFSEFITNRIQANFAASRTGLFGTDDSKSKASATVLVTDGANIYALCHVQDTPLTLWDPGTDWAGMTGTLGHGAAQVSIHSLSFDSQDPRVVFMPITEAEAAQLGAKVYSISSDPYKFQDAVVIGAQADNYGQSSFQIEMSTPQYVKLDRSLLKGLFGKFNPSRGDLVFSRTGDLLGIMANSSYCLMLHSFIPAATFQFGTDLRAQHTGDILSQLYGTIFRLPLKLQ